MALDDYLVLLKKLHTIYGTSHLHELKEEKEGWDMLKISIQHTRTLQCSEEEFEKELFQIYG